MFRVGVRRFTTTATWRASQGSIITEASQRQLVDVSTHQGVAARGLVDGKVFSSYSISSFIQEHVYIHIQKSYASFYKIIRTFQHQANRFTSNRQNPPHPAKTPLQRHRLRHSRQSRVPEPRRLRQGPGRAVRCRERRAPRPAATGRHRCRGHGGQHGHRAGARVPVQGLPARHLHAQHAITRQDRSAEAAGRRSARGAGGGVRQPGELQPPGEAACAGARQHAVDEPVRQRGEPAGASGDDRPRDLASDGRGRRDD